MVRDPKSKSAYVKELRGLTKKLNKAHNHEVDTNVKIVKGKTEKKMLLKVDEDTEIVLYTTNHHGSACKIYEMISSYLDAKKARIPQSRG